MKLPQILERIIIDENLAWGKSLEDHTEKFLINLSSDTIVELTNKRTELENSGEDDFPSLKNEILQLKNKILINGIGFFIIKGSNFSNFTKDEIKKIYEIISKIIGKLYVQNIKNEKFVVIKDEGKSMQTGGRYHQTREGGSYHTDSPQWSEVPDFIGLYCVNPAKNGGTSKFVSACTVHNHILKKEKNILKVLYQKFFFDKRGEFTENESPTVFEPIFELKDGKLNCRYLRDYIDGGHKIQNQPLTESQKHALDYLDKTIQQNDFVVSYDLKANDIVFFNNHRIFHGRTSFKDYENENLKRFLIRVWIKNREC